MILLQLKLLLEPLFMKIQNVYQTAQYEKPIVSPCFSLTTTTLGESALAVIGVPLLWNPSVMHPVLVIISAGTYQHNPARSERKRLYMLFFHLNLERIIGTIMTVLLTSYH